MFKFKLFLDINIQETNLSIQSFPLFLLLIFRQLKDLIISSIDFFMKAFIYIKSIQSVTISTKSTGKQENMFSVFFSKFSWTITFTFCS